MYQFTGQGQNLLEQAKQLHTESNDARAKRRFERAAHLLEQAYKLRRTALISPHPVLTATVDSLAHLYQQMCEYEKWRDYAKIAVEEKKAMLGELHVETQHSLNNLHDAHIACGDFEAAAETRAKNWHARTSTLGIKDEEVSKDGLVGDIERMLDYWRKVMPSIRRSTDTGQDLETRLRLRDGTGGADRQAAVAAAQEATKALMQCDFNDRRPVKRDPELEQLLVNRMTPADYVVQFGKMPDARWITKDNTVWLDANGNPGTPPPNTLASLPGAKKPGAGGLDGGASQKSGASAAGDVQDSLAGDAPPPDSQNGGGGGGGEEEAPPEEEGVGDEEAPPEDYEAPPEE